MRLIIISGRSGSGKTAALNLLEDQGFYCIDNLPVGLLPELTQQVNQDGILSKVAVSIDARNIFHALEQFPSIVEGLKAQGVNIEVIFLDASDEILMQRFSSTRRKHPLSNQHISLKEAIIQEGEMLEAISQNADLAIDTTLMSVHELRSLIKLRVIHHQPESMAILFESFGFKHGIPINADIVFDARCLPNPYWDTSLRQFTGKDQAIIDFLEPEDIVQNFFSDITDYLNKWLDEYQASNKSYMTVAIGCTGGQHRSVFMTEKLYRFFKDKHENLQIRHRELPDTSA